ncbi:MAG TPA: hypothetical protein VNM37_00575, partial [Candidatus Dormibacteraeota bacterium]|nr:hypothetical protein [Candidatus Dormibacteraeota bacterium]
MPPNTAIFGTAMVTPTGGVGDSGVLRLTEAANDQNGSFIIEDQDAGAVIGSMVATFDLQLGPGTAPPADGFSFNWANDLPSSTFNNGAEEGAGTGLTVSFDAYDNGGGEAPSIDIKWHGTTVASRKFTVADLSVGAFAPVVIRLDRDGTVDVAYAGELVHSNVQVGSFSGQANARFGFAARTGGANEAQYVDNIKLTTVVCTDCLLVFLTQPDDAAVLANSSATFTAAVNAPGSATFQWQRKGAGEANFANVGGATATSYTTPPLAVADSQSQYRLIVTGPLNTITSRVATVSVLNLVRPTTDLDISFDFNDGLTPPDSQLFGTATVTPTGGVGDSGVLHLNDAANDQSGAILITRQLEGGRAVDRFIAAFDARVDEGTPLPADGYSFNWATDLPAGTYGAAEEGAGTGLTVSFDTWDNGGGEAPAVTLKWQGNTVTNRNVPLDVLRTAPGTFKEVLVALDPDGTVDVAYGGQVLLYNVALPNFTPLANAMFGFAGRTGGANENHWIDNIAIQTFQSAAPPLITQQPADQTLLAGATATLSVRVSDPLVISGYQWQQKAPGAGAFVNIPGATSPDFTTPPLAVTDNGIQYRALIAVTVPVVTLTSRAATITVIDIPIPPPTVSYDFNDAAVPPGAAV